MIWQWLTCSSALAVAAAAATLTGSVALVDSAERGVKKRRDYSGVVAWLEPLDGAAPAPAGRPLRATMVQRNKTFLPHMLAVQVGTAVDFPNQDPIFHNAFSNYDGQLFDVHLYAPQTTRRVVFRRPGMVRVFCNIHATMSAVIAVLPTPYFAVTGPNGRFSIQAPAGAYRLRLWHERGQEETLGSLARQVNLAESGLALPEISVSEQGYLATPHKNKYGRDYPPAPDQHVFYPGGRR